MLGSSEGKWEREKTGGVSIGCSNVLEVNRSHKRRLLILLYIFIFSLSLLVPTNSCPHQPSRRPPVLFLWSEDSKSIPTVHGFFAFSCICLFKSLFAEVWNLWNRQSLCLTQVLSIRQWQLLLFDIQFLLQQTLFWWQIQSFYGKLVNFLFLIWQPPWTRMDILLPLPLRATRPIEGHGGGRRKGATSWWCFPAVGGD